MRAPHLLRVILTLCLACIAAVNTGCMAIPIAAMGMSAAGAANILGGDRAVALQMGEPEKATLSGLLKGSRRIALLDSGPATETIEAAGLASPVAAQYGNSSKMSPSQQKETMQRACASERGDAVVSARTGDTRTNRMTYLIGKADTEIDMDVHVLNCRTKATGTVRVMFKFDAAIQGSGDEVYRRAGVAFGKAIAQLSESN